MTKYKTILFCFYRLSRKNNKINEKKINRLSRESNPTKKKTTFDDNLTYIDNNQVRF